ncbi:hypothetical protein [Terrabacter carboxydivorans]|uniref:hypothetical protein n=1 Tax=Terrabacter carboxydivorans TaxID=619730 RepID=UPI0031DC5EB0
MTSTGERTRHPRAAARRLAVGVCSVGLLLSIGACSKDGGSAMAARVAADAGPVTGVPAAAGPVPGSSTGPATGVPTDLPAATTTPSSAPATGDTPILVGRRVTAARAGLSFEVPAGWQAFDPSRVTRASAAALPQAAKDLAANSGLSVEEYLKQVGRAIEVMVMGPVTRGAADNISVIPTPASRLPTEDDLRAQLESVGAKVVRVDRTTTPLGPAIVAESRLPMATFVTHTRSVAVEHDGLVTFLTVTATTRASAESLLRQMLATLRPA